MSDGPDDDAPLLIGELNAPFPYYGGKRRIAAEVWEAFGDDVAHYVEPFCGSAAVLLARPRVTGRELETVNDVDCFLTNFWRAVARDPDAVARYVDGPINECDLHARHAWLWAQRAELRARLDADPDAYDAKIAGWWCWGAGAWMGGGWCSGSIYRRKPVVNGHSHGRGVHALGFEPVAALRALARRLRRVRVCCGDFMRVLTPGVLWGDRARTTVTAVFMDPPYAHDADRDPGCYGENDDPLVAVRARAWCAEMGAHPRLRIVLAGYDTEHAELEALGWRVVAWSASGWRFSAKATANQHRERLWLSPGCITAAPPQQELFG